MIPAEMCEVRLPYHACSYLDGRMSLVLYDLPESRSQRIFLPSALTKMLPM